MGPGPGPIGPIHLGPGPGPIVHIHLGPGSFGPIHLGPDVYIYIYIYIYISADPWIRCVEEKRATNEVSRGGGGKSGNFPYLAPQSLFRTKGTREGAFKPDST